MRNGENVVVADFRCRSGKSRPPDVGHIRNEGRIRAPVEAKGEPLLAVKALRRESSVRNASFEICSGEIVGLWGLLGSVRSDPLRALVGLDPIDAGTISWRGGESLEPITPERLRVHVGLITEDRRGEGVFLPLSVSDNIALPNLKSLLNKWRLVDRGRQTTLADAMIDRLKNKASSRDQVVATLSGAISRRSCSADGRRLTRVCLLLTTDSRSRRQRQNRN